MTAHRDAGLRGLLPPKKTNLPHLHTLSAEPVSPPAKADVSHAWKDWLMLGNGPDDTLTINDKQPVGDCMFAGMFHGLVVKALEQSKAHGKWDLREGFTMPTADQVVGLYLGYQRGLPPGQSATSGPDRGTVLADGLKWFQKAGIIKRYGPVHLDPLLLEQAVVDHKGVIVGVSLDEDAETEFSKHKEWREYSEIIDPIVGGHAIYEVAYTPEDVTYLTWAERQKASKDWQRGQVTEAWWFQAPWEPDAPGYDFHTLDVALGIA